jgi:hypothetical protein
MIGSLRALSKDNASDRHLFSCSNRNSAKPVFMRWLRHADRTSFLAAEFERGTSMRHSFIAIAAAMTTVFVVTMPAKAGNYSYGYRQTCVVKTVKSYGAYGRVVMKKVRSCK